MQPSFGREASSPSHRKLHRSPPPPPRRAVDSATDAPTANTQRLPFRYELHSAIRRVLSSSVSRTTANSRSSNDHAAGRRLLPPSIGEEGKGDAADCSSRTPHQTDENDGVAAAFSRDLSGWSRGSSPSRSSTHEASTAATTPTPRSPARSSRQASSPLLLSYIYNADAAAAKMDWSEEPEQPSDSGAVYVNDLNDDDDIDDVNLLRVLEHWFQVSVKVHDEFRSRPGRWTEDDRHILATMDGQLDEIRQITDETEALFRQLSVEKEALFNLSYVEWLQRYYFGEAAVARVVDSFRDETVGNGVGTRRGRGSSSMNPMLLANIPPESIAVAEALKKSILRGSIVQVKKLLRKNSRCVKRHDVSAGLVQYAVRSGSSADMVRFLASTLPNDLRRDDDGIPLHLAIHEGRWELIEGLVEAGPEAAAKEVRVDSLRFLPLHLAVMENAPAHAVELLTNAHPDALRVKGPPSHHLPLHIAAAKECRIETFLFLLDKYEMGLREKSRSGFLPLHVAIYNHTDVEKVQIIADRYPQALLEETHGDNCKKLLPLHLAALMRSPLVVVQVLAYKAPITLVKKTKAAFIPLYFALYRSTPDVIEFLARMTGACRVLVAFLSHQVAARLARRREATKLQAIWRRAVAYRRYCPVIRSRVQFRTTWSKALELVEAAMRQRVHEPGPDWAKLREKNYDMERCLRAEALRSLEEEAHQERPNDENQTPHDTDREDGADLLLVPCGEASDRNSHRGNGQDDGYVALRAYGASLPHHITQATNRVLLTNDALKWCRNGDPKYVGFFLRRVEQLASGQRSRILAKRLKGDFKAAIFETYLEQKSGHRILWTAEALGEVLLWHVVAHKDVSRFARLIDSSLGRSSRQLAEALSTLGIDAAVNNAISHPDAIVLDPLGNTPLKLYAVTSKHIPQLADPAWTPPLRLTPEERVVVESTGTTLVLGRSGTGKTICLCSKMDFDRHLIGSSASFTQLFVARSDRLRRFVKKAVNATDACAFHTFDELIRKLEQSLTISRKFSSHQRVNFVRFKRDFYRDPKLWGGVDALVAWTNIRSFIKGSIDAVSSACMILSDDDYLSVEKLGKKRCRLPHEHRLSVCKAFRAYKVYLEENGLWDDCDRISYLIQSLTKLKEMHPDEFERLRHGKVYVDECQDFTQAEILLFFLLSRSGDLFLCGDPAQSVVEGVQFRFKEVRSVAHFAVGASHRHLVPQKPMTLNVNYRSHSGIMKTAVAVQKRMTHYFPDETNLLERGLFFGPRPGVLFEVDLSTLNSALPSTLSGSTVLVHDEHEALCTQQLDGYKLVYGIREAKGLEFKCVILFDFFAGVPKELQKPWRDLLLGNEVADFASRFPEMEGQMKLLYTAITRSVDRLIFVESKRSVAGEAFVRWSTTTTTRANQSSMDEEPLAMVQKVDDIESFQMSVDEWSLAGFDSAVAAEGTENLESARSFLEAALHCFQKAGNSRFVTKVQLHLSSVQFRSSPKGLDVEPSNPLSREPLMADLLSRLVREGLWNEAAKVCEAGLPHLSEHARTELRANLLPMLPRA